MGFNPYRKQRRRPGDYVLMVAGFVAVALLLLWAVRG